MATGSLTPTHPWLACVQRVAEAVDTVAHAGAPDPDFLPEDDKADLLLGLDREITRLTALRSRVLAGADDLAARDGFKNAAAWLAAATRSDGARPRADLKLGLRLLRRPATASAFGAAALSPEHATAVLDSLDRLPHDVDAGIVADVERRLVDLCSERTPREIRRLGVHVLEVVAPDEADAILERLLAADEERARSLTRLTQRSRGDGTSAVVAVVPDLYGDLLATVLDAWTNPARSHLDGEPGGVHEPAATTGDPEVDRLTWAEKRGRAFCHLLEHLGTDGVPVAGGTPVGVTVVVTEDRLRREAGAAIVQGTHGIDDGLHLSIGAVRRLLCAHGALPVIMSGDSVVLDHGRRKRLFTADQVRAARLTRETCQADGCTVPSRWCEAHHRDPWAAGGTTDLAKLVFLCSHHHQRVHDPAYRHEHDAAGRITFTRINRRT